MWCRFLNVWTGDDIIDRVTPKVGTKTDSRLAARLAAISSFGSAVIHVAVLPTHWQEWTASGLFFASIALFQLVWALMVAVRPTAAVLAAGILVTVVGQVLSDSTWAQARGFRARCWPAWDTTLPRSIPIVKRSVTIAGG